MAGVTVTTNADIMDVDFGDYGDGIKLPYEATYDCKDIIKVERYADYVVIKVRDELTWYLCYTATESYMIIDEVDGVAPTSNQDLYNKLKVLVC